jgi:hypothetical protein
MSLMRLLIYAVVGFVVYTLFRRMMGQRTERAVPQSDPDEKVARLTQCPNCQVYVDMQAAVRKRAGQGELFFCSEPCAKEYLEQHKV